jgi:ABC-type polysaccharide/polyol phosphate export permease
MVLLFALIWSLATMAGFANAYFQDTQHLLDVAFQILFYLTPIVYDPSMLGEGSRLHWLVSNLNPLVPFFQLLREPILYARWPTVQTYAAASITVVLLTGVASYLCGRLQRRLIFQL